MDHPWRTHLGLILGDPTWETTWGPLRRSPVAGIRIGGPSRGTHHGRSTSMDSLGGTSCGTQFGETPRGTRWGSHLEYPTGDHPWGTTNMGPSFGTTTGERLLGDQHWGTPLLGHVWGSPWVTPGWTALGGIHLRDPTLGTSLSGLPRGTPSSQLGGPSWGTPLMGTPLATQLGSRLEGSPCATTLTGPFSVDPPGQTTFGRPLS